MKHYYLKIKTMLKRKNPRFVKVKTIIPAENVKEILVNDSLNAIHVKECIKGCSFDIRKNDDDNTSLIQKQIDSLRSYVEKCFLLLFAVLFLDGLIYLFS